MHLSAPFVASLEVALQGVQELLAVVLQAAREPLQRVQEPLAAVLQASREPLQRAQEPLAAVPQSIQEPPELRVSELPEKAGSQKSLDRSQLQRISRQVVPAKPQFSAHRECRCGFDQHALQIHAPQCQHFANCIQVPGRSAQLLLKLLGCLLQLLGCLLQLVLTPLEMI